MNGLVLIDKPKGLTSHDVVNRWRRLAITKRTGHLGTLDPMATGLLVLLSGNTTRLARFFERQDKGYEAEIRLGFVSDTYDADGTVQAIAAALPNESAIIEALGSFRGSIQQVPPPVSAKKVGGVRAYKLARKGQPVELAPVSVEIKRLEERFVSADTIRLYVECSAGTYIRSFAHDLGQSLGCGAILTALRRVSSGAFQIAGAYTLAHLENLACDGTLASAVVPPVQILPEFPSYYVDDFEITQIRQGRDFRTSPFVVPPCAPLVKALSHSGDLVSIGEFKFPNVYHPLMVL